MNYKGAILRMLKDYGAYQAYVENFRLLDRYGNRYKNDSTFNEFLEELLDIRGGAYRHNIEDIFYYFINDSFTWDKTREGGTYWCDILSKMSRIGKILEKKEFPASSEELEYSRTIKKILDTDGKKGI